MILSPWKNHFPSLTNKQVYYLDSAATTQVPQQVIDAVVQYLSTGCGNPGRGSYSQSEQATLVVAECRKKVAQFINASCEQVVFTKGTTESINLVAQSLRSRLTTNGSILVSQMEHHSNLLPWQKLCQQTGARLNVLPITTKGELDCSNLEALLKDHCLMLAITHCSNVLGQLNPIRELCKKAKTHGVEILIDGAQNIAHNAINVEEIDCDYYVFSGHKLYASGGSGVLFVKNLNKLRPLLLGGGIVTKVTDQDHRLQQGISRLEAGSANMVALTGLRSAIDFIEKIGLESIAEHEQRLTLRLYEAIGELDGFTIVSHPSSQNIVSFYHKEIHSHDIASVLAGYGISVRAGHHCAQPCLAALGIKHCVRASVALYNEQDDVDAIIKGLIEAEKVFLGLSF